MDIYIILILAALMTAFISGLFGMAGGMIFLGIIASCAFLLRQNICWKIISFHTLGALPAILILGAMSFLPSKAFIYLALGLLPFMLWLPRGWMQGDAQRPRDAILCGFMIIGLNLTAGVAGPVLDFFYVKAALTRLQIVATKAVTMFFANMVKIIYFGLPLMVASELSGLPPLWVFAAALPAVMIGTFTGTRVLKRLSDIKFKSYTKYLVTLIGCVYLWRRISLLLTA